MDYQHITQQSIIDTKRHHTPPPTQAKLKEALQIERTAPGSVAEKAGLQVGDIFINITTDHDAGLIPSTVDLAATSIHSTQCNYQFYRPSSSELLEVRTNGCPLGIKFMPTPDSLIDMATYIQMTHEDLIAIWRTKNWPLLNQASEMLLDWKAHRNFGGKCIGFIGKYPNKFNQMLGYAGKGIALYETGDAEAALSYLLHFNEHFSDYFPGELNAIIHYYFARYHLLIDDRERAIAEMGYAIQLEDRYDTLQALYEQLHGHRFVHQSKWQDKHLGLEYTLDILHKTSLAGTQASLSPALNQCSREQIFVLCLMPTIRTCGYYMTCLHEYLAHFKYFTSAIAGMHVIFDTLDHHPQSASQLDEEAKLKQRMPSAFEVLYDDDREVMSRLKPEGYPYFIFINKQQEVVYEGTPTNSYDWCNMLQKINQSTRQAA
jgi:tetratricopeptide (TPR) repeat protein